MIYFDNPATSFPKPPQVAEAVYDCIAHLGGSPGRGGHRMASAANQLVFECRERLAEFFHFPGPERMVFTQNCTDSLNMGLKGVLRRGDRVITTSMEHNSMVRPLKRLEAAGVGVDVVEADATGRVSPADIERKITPATRMIACIHVSNVCGTVQPIREIGRIAKRRGIVFLVDAAQSAGILPINVKEDHIDLLCFPGHKGLLGPQGTGGLYVGEGVEMLTLREGGTGSNSESVLQPLFYPDRLESGTLNLPGIAGLLKGVEYLMEEGERAHRREKQLFRKLWEGCMDIPGVTLYGHPQPEQNAGVLSMRIGELDAVECAERLSREFGIATRGGLHCAPWAHRSIGTLSTGTVRFGLSPFTTEKEVDDALVAVREMAHFASG